MAQWQVDAAFKRLVSVSAAVAVGVLADLPRVWQMGLT